MRFSRLLDLKVGDLLVLEGSEASPLPVFVQGRRKLTGAPRVAGGSLAVMLDRGFAEMKASPQFPNPGGIH